MAGATPPPLPAAFRLEPFSPGNTDLVLELRNHPMVRAGSLDDREITRDGHAAFLKALAEDPARRYALVFFGETLVAAMNVTFADDHAHWGCYLADPERPKPGVFPALVGIAGRIAFSDPGCTTLCSDVLASNPAPQKLNRFLGIAQSGTRELVRPDGSAVEVIEYATARTDWPGVEARIRALLTSTQRAALEAFDPGAGQETGG